MKKRKHSFLRGALCGALAVLLLTAAGALALYMNYGLPWTDKEKKVEIVTVKKEKESKEEKKLKLIKKYIDGHYIGDIDAHALTEGIYEGYVRALGDPYSAYYDEEDMSDLLETTSGEYYGIGAVMSKQKDSGIITLLRVYEKSPAEEAGLKENDILYKVNDREVTGEDLNDVIRSIRSDEEGTTVKITVLRGDKAEEISADVERRNVEAQTVDYKLRDDGIGYIRVTEFDTVTAAQYELAFHTLEVQGMKGLVVDLRNNPGGNLTTVCKMLDLMLPEGTMVYTEDRNGKRKDYTSDAEHQFTKPMVVLMNESSASASEIYAGAMQDYGIAKVVGTQSYGKGVVQQLIDLKDGTGVKLTIAEYFTPKGRNINGVGITPDEVIEYKASPDNPEADNQLDRAAELLNHPPPEEK